MVVLVRISPDMTSEADVCYVSYAKSPAALKLPDGVIEVRSPSDLWTDALGKMLDYLRVGVPVVVILDPKTESASVYRPGARQQIFEKDQTLTLPDVLPGFEVPVACLFEE